MKYSLRQLQVFSTVARTLHFGRAAQELFTSQAMVSQDVKRVESKLGALLFDRSTRRVTLTPTGESLLPLANAVLSAAGEFERVANVMTQAHAQRIRLAASPSSMNGLIPRVLQHAERELPDLTVEDIAVETGEVAPALLTGNADIGVGRFLTLPDTFTQATLGSDEVLVALSTQHPLAATAQIELADLVELPLLLWPRERSPEYFDYLLDLCQERGLDPLILVSQPRIIGSRSYIIAENRAFGLVPRSAEVAITPGIATRPLAEPATLPLFLAWRANDPRTAVRELGALIRRIAKN